MFLAARNLNRKCPLNEDVHTVSFTLVPRLANHLLHLRDRVMTSHDTWTSGTSRVLTIPSLHRLKLEAAFPAPANYEVRFLIKPFRTSGAGCLVPVLSCCTITLGNTRLDGLHNCCRSKARRCLIIHPIARISRPVLSIFSYKSRNSCPVSVNVSRMTERRR